MRPILLLSAYFLLTFADFDECEVCITFASYVDSLKDLPYDYAKSISISSLKFYPQETRTFLTTLIRYNFRKLYLDVNEAYPGMSHRTSCSDLGYCNYSMGYQSPFPIHWLYNDQWKNNSNIRDVRDRTIVVLHDTETLTLNDTIRILLMRGLSVTYIIDVDGEVYQLVPDFHRAWHAGVGIWKGDGCAVGDTNSRSIGIETVNSGVDPFPEQQIASINRLIGYLHKKWHISPQNIIAHHENGPNYKFDISGYFSWKRLYDELDELTPIWDSHLSEDQKKEVLLNQTIQNPELLLEVQRLLFSHGYGTVVVGDPYSFSNSSKVTTAMAVQSFNRKFCPELFVLESMVHGDQIPIPANQQVYGLTMERLQWVASHQSVDECTNN